MTNKIVYSLVIPVYKNEENIPDLLEALTDLWKEMGEGLEIIFVVDGSPDRSWPLLHEALPRQPFASQLILLARNFGSFSAIRASFDSIRGDYIAVMAADLQEPPELVIDFFHKLENDEADIVFGQRMNRNDPWLTKIMSQCFWSMYRRFIIPDIPPGGVDIFGCNRKIIDVLLTINEQNSSLLAQLFWIGHRRVFIPYTRRERLKGKSAWSFAKKIKYLLDSIFSFSSLPILALLWIGIISVSLTSLVGLITVVAYLFGYIAVDGYSSLVTLIAFTSSVLLLTQGILGSYLWRCFENTKNRPLSIIQSVTQWDSKNKTRGDSQTPPHSPESQK